MKILFYTNIPSPYRVDFFNELGKYCELTVLFEINSSTERDDAWKEFTFDKFNGIILKGIRTRNDAAFCPQIVAYLKKTYDHIVVTQIASVTAIWAVAYMRFKGIKYAYEGDGGFSGNITGMKAAIKRYIIGNAEYCFSTSATFDEYCRIYGAKERKIYRYPLTSINENELLNSPLSIGEKKELRKLLNITEEQVLLSVGQYIYRKGFDLLLEMAHTLPANVGIYIIGGTPTPEYLELKERWSLEHVHFVEFMKKDQLSLWYQAADVFVFPTREDIWGLVVNEAMANGLPVVSTDRCLAAVEMIEDGKNGYIVPVNNVLEMQQAVNVLLCGHELYQSMSENALETIRTKYTIEKMVQEHLEIFKKE